MSSDWQHAAEVYLIVAFVSCFLWTEHRWIIALMCASFLVLDVVFPAPPPFKPQASDNISDTPPKLLTREHLDPIASRKWKTVLAWIAFCPDELQLCDKKKQTILHHACLFRAPADVIEMILYAAPELASMRNEDGEIALHWAIRLSAPKEIVKMLLSANPTSGFHAKDKDGSTPLSLIWDRHRCEFLEAWWMGGGKGVLSLNSWKRVLLLLQYNSNQVCRDTSTREDIDADVDAEAETPLPFRPLHVAAQSPCPPGVFSLLISVYRNELTVKDEDGRLPLHIAATNATTNRSYDVQSKISMLLTEYQEAARIADASGRLPIYIALESGIAWDEGIQDLFALEPKIMGVRDCVTSLYPFMLAAVGGGRRRPVTTDAAETHECQVDHSLSTIYTSLRADPAIVKSYIGTSVMSAYKN
jgi:ankyrin repeat protein